MIIFCHLQLTIISLREEKIESIVKNLLQFLPERLASFIWENDRTDACDEKRDDFVKDFLQIRNN